MAKPKEFDIEELCAIYVKDGKCPPYDPTQSAWNMGVMLKGVYEKLCELIEAGGTMANLAAGGLEPVCNKETKEFLGFMCKVLRDSDGDGVEDETIVKFIGPDLQEAEPPAPGTWEPCTPEQKFLECWKTKTFLSGMENTGTQTQYFYEGNFILAGGGKRPCTLPAASGAGEWLEQMDVRWQGAAAACFPDLCEVKNHWADWKTSQLPQSGTATIDQTDMVPEGEVCPPLLGQYIQFTACPKDYKNLPIGFEVTATDDPRIKPGYQLKFKTAESEEESIYRCVTCDEQGEAPKCAIPKGEEWPLLPDALCSSETVFGFDCVWQEDEDGNILFDQPPTQTPVIAVATSCPDQPFGIEYFTDDGNGNLDPYDIQGIFGNSDCIPIEIKEDCDSDGKNCISITLHIAGGDNNWWGSLAGAGIIRFNHAIDFETILQNGTVVQWSQAPTAGWSAQVVANGQAQAAAIVAAGGTGCVGAGMINRPAPYAGLPIPPAGTSFPNVFVRGWYIACCDEGWLPVKSTIISSPSNPGQEGREYDHSPQTVEWCGYQRTKCGLPVGAPIGVDGKTFDFPLPSSECIQPCEKALLELLEVIEECGDAALDPETGQTVTTPVATESQPTGGFAIVGADPLPAWNGGLPATLKACLGDTIVDTLIDPMIPPGATTFTLEWETLDVGQDRACVKAYDVNTGAVLTLSAASEIFAPDIATTGPTVGTHFATWAIPSGVDPADIRVVWCIVGGVINSPDPGLCDEFELIRTLSDAPVPAEEKGFRNCWSEAQFEKLCEIANNTAPPPSVTCEQFWIARCDDIGGGTVELFYRGIQACYEDGLEISRVSLGDYEDDLITPYTIQGTEVDCGLTQFPDAQKVILCDRGRNGGYDFFQYSTVVSSTSVIVIDTELDGQTPYTVLGPVEPGPCPNEPTTENCTVTQQSLFQTYATAAYTITSVTIGGEDVSAKFTLPVNGNNAPALIAFRDELVACLEARGSDVTVQIGRDGWSLSWIGEAVTLGQTGANGDVTSTQSTFVQVGQHVALTKCQFDKLYAKMCSIDKNLTCKPCPKLDLGDITETDNGSGLVFPVTTPPGVLQDFVVPFSLDDPDNCLAGIDPATKISVRFHFDGHDLVTGANGTTGFNWTVGGATSGAMLTGESATNTFNNTGNIGSQTAGVGTLNGPGLDLADRYLDFDIPLGELLASNGGTTANSCAFGSSNAGTTETLANFRMELLTDMKQFCDCDV